eukprot:gene29999-37145_t
MPPPALTANNDYDAGHRSEVTALLLGLNSQTTPKKPVKVFADSTMTSLEEVVSSIRRERTLREVLLEDFKQQVDFSAITPSLTSVHGQPQSVVSSSGSVVNNAFTQQATLVSDITTSSAEAPPQQYMVQGVIVSLDFPIYDLWCLMAHADLFLYISCI